MSSKTLFLLVLLCFCAVEALPQCTTLGQTPSTAFPVCGADTFSQQTVPICINNVVPASTCGFYPDTNPFWYQFTCFQTGTLRLLISPDSADQDYDFELFDITGHDPNDVYTDDSLFVVANWCGTYGQTGTEPGVTDPIECASDPSQNVSPFSLMPTLIQGHTYLLLVSHYTSSQSGYQLTLTGGTAVITEPGLPFLQNASMQCDGVTVGIKLSKKVKCSTLAPNGSDFTVSDPSAAIVSATGVNCDNAFDFDSVIIKLNSPLAPGSYQIAAAIGTDGNTLLDDCNNSVPVGDSAILLVYPLVPTPFDSLLPVGCAPSTLNVVFRKQIQCSSIAPDGSDFKVTGPAPVIMQSAAGICDSNGLSGIVQINLASPLYTGGSYQLTLVTGDDGNTLLDECGLQTPAGAVIPFVVQDTVDATFSYQLSTGCRYDSLQFSGSTANGVNAWQWTFDSAGSSGVQDPLQIDSAFSTHMVQLIVSNGTCSDTSVSTIVLNNAVAASFSAPDSICPSDEVLFQNTSVGSNINSWYWDFGDGSTSTDQTPPAHLFPSSPGEAVFKVSLVAQNSLGCSDTATRLITKFRSCYITVPSGFTPNGDGINDYLYPLNALKAVDLEFRVYNRYGQLVFESRDWTKKWDGTVNGKPQDTSTFVWTLQYTDRDTGKKYFLKGTTVLIR